MKQIHKRPENWPTPDLSDTTKKLETDLKSALLKLGESRRNVQLYIKNNEDMS